MTEMEIDMSLFTSGEEQHTKSNCVNDEQEFIDKSRDVYQRTTWDKLHMSIVYLLCKVNGINIGTVKKELLKQNILRGQNLFCNFIIQAQLTSCSNDTHVYATLVAVINLVFPEIGELVLNRIIMKFKCAFFQYEETDALASAVFIGHLINHNVADEKLAVELLTLLLKEPSIFSIEIAIAFLEICSKRVSEVFKMYLNNIFDTIHSLLDDEQLDEEVCNVLSLRLSVLYENGFKFKHLDLLPTNDCQITHFSTFDSIVDDTLIKIEYEYDPEFETNEKLYKMLVSQFQEDDDEEDDDEEDDDEEENGFESVNKFYNQYDGEKKLIGMIKYINDIGKDINMISLRNICLREVINLIVDTPMDYKKYLKEFILPDQEMEFCFMILDCCCERRTYKDNFGLLAKKYKLFFDLMEIMFIHCFVTSYNFDIQKSYNTAKFFAHIIKIGLIPYKFISIIEDKSNCPNEDYAKILHQEIHKTLYHNNCK
ncbi:pre-mRNA-splicing factor CWC22 homolog [Rhopalosiphum padi]|uniref:pre-mRNA-splicing factor CWC22 homolog n=1 Tax=Rhopalosiphum padi TaxID=40932 RepID=UPI00298E0C27|nr:pre-mRNA-splicing factor CWC22 homolog [Rhopalosiphum padi]